MNLYEKIDSIQHDIDYKISYITHTAIYSYGRNTLEVTENLIKEIIGVSRLIIEKENLVKDINRLRERDKMLLDLRYRSPKKLTHEEIAKQLGISIRTLYRKLELLNYYL